MHSTDSLTQKLPQQVRFSQSDLTCITSSTRSLELSTQVIEIVPEGVGEIGSVVVCEVVSVGAHDKAENRFGRFVRLNPGDLIMGVMGNRYSTLSMDGGVPESGINFPSEKALDLLSSGGVIGECYSSPSYLGSPTQLRVLGLAYQEGKPLKVTPHLRAMHLHITCPLILIAGTCANVGKTKFASKLIHFVSHDLGLNVAATKLAGAGNLDDLLNLKEHGAKYTFDFVDAGLVTTYGDSDDTRELVIEVAKGILNHLGENRPDMIIVELGGDILGANVPAILADNDILANTKAIVLVPSDIFAASGALSYLRERGFQRNIDVAQPLKNPGISQKRAQSILHCRLYDCEKTEDLENLVKDTLGWVRKTNEQSSQKEGQEAFHAIPTS